MDTLNQEQIGAALNELTEWGFKDEALTRTLRFADFVHAVDFVEHLAEVAEERQHHPDIDIRYNKVTLRLSTHSAGGVTTRDVDLAEGHRPPGVRAARGPRRPARAASPRPRPAPCYNPHPCPRSSGD